MKTTLKKFLLEATVKDSVRRKKGISTSFGDIRSVMSFVSNVLMKKCPKAFTGFLETGIAIYRGMDDSGAALEVDYSKGIRKAQNTQDYYRMMIDSNPTFEKFPKRNRSLIATTDFNYSKAYGEPYYIFPIDSAEVGVVNNLDIFDVMFNMFDKIEINVDDVSRFFGSLFNHTNHDGKIKLKTGVITPEDFVKNIDALGMHTVLNWLQLKSFIHDDEITVKQFEQRYGIKDGATFLEYMYKKVLNRANLGFSVLKVSAFFDPSNKQRTEVWISDKCIAVRVASLQPWLSDVKRLLNDPLARKKVFESFSSDDISIEEAAEIINTRCDEWKKFTGGFPTDNLNWIIYRGMRVHFGADFALKSPRSNRRPLTTNEDVHAFADEYFQQKFGIKFRSNSIFTSRSTELAKYYGDVYAIFPLDRVSFAWSEKVEDFTNDSADYRKRKLGTASKEPLSKDETFEMLDSFEYHFNDNSLKDEYFKYRDYKGYELMIACDEYLAVRAEILPKVLDLLDYRK